jgi:hypothetical protein
MTGANSGAGTMYPFRGDLVYNGVSMYGWILIFIENLLAFELFSFHFDPRSCKSKYQTGQFAIIQRQELTFDSKKRCLNLVANGIINVSLVIRNTRSFPHSWLITGFVTRVTWPVPIVEQEPCTLSEETWFIMGFVSF